MVAPLPSVLFVDDEELVCRAFRRGLKSSPFSVETSTSGSCALAKVRAKRFDVVVVDLRLPGIDGLTLIERMRRLQPTLVFLIVTGMPDLDLRRSEETRASILATLAKPWDQEELLELLDRAVELSRTTVPEEESSAALPVALMVEDDPADAYMLRRELENRCGLCVEHVGRVSEAEVLLSRRRYDLVVSDLSLPDARGTDSVRRLRRAAPKSPLIVMTSMTDDSLAREIMTQGAQELLVKGGEGYAALPRSVALANGRFAYVSGLMDLAQYDQLTGLANRRTLRARFSYAARLAKERGGMIGFVCIDLDRFKAVNDTLGHEAGDLLLQEIAARLSAVVRDEDTVARLGGDEFGVLLCDLADLESGQRVVDRIMEAMDEPLKTPYGTIQPRMSLGLVTYAGDIPPIDDVMRVADNRMYLSKRLGRQGTTDPGSAFALEEELREAVRERRFHLHYQPMYKLDGTTIVGFEALMRWTRADGTPVSPGVFIPMLEEFGLIQDLGPWLLDEACAELGRWRAQGGSVQARMSVNISGRQFDAHGLVEQTKQALARHALEPAALELEITESVLMRDTRMTRSSLDALAALGVRVAIDDFGTGYSSLAYLQRFRVATLKVDRCFVQGLEDGRSACIASAVISLGRSLGMRVVAEGVESESQLERLRAEGCDVAQGFLLSRPLASTQRVWASSASGVGELAS